MVFLKNFCRYNAGKHGLFIKYGIGIGHFFRVS